MASGILEYSTKNKYNTVISNAAMHWVTNPKSAYTKIYTMLKDDATIAIHQGGYDSYIGLHTIVKEAILNLKLQKFYANWTYPIYYPTQKDIESLLHEIGYLNITVNSVESSGKEHPTLPIDFLNAGMLPYLQQLWNDKVRKQLSNEYIIICKQQGKNINLYSNRLYIFAKKGK